MGDGPLQVQAKLALARLARLAALDSETRRFTFQIELLLGDHPLLDLPGVGIVTAAKVIAEAGDLRRFRSADAFADLADGMAVAPPDGTGDPGPARSGLPRVLRGSGVMLASRRVAAPGPPRDNRDGGLPTLLD